MQFTYKWARLPADQDLKGATNAAASRLYDKLTNAGIHGPRMDNYYRKRFYEVHLHRLASKLRNCAYHVMWAVASSQRPLSEMSLIDHGGGFGFIGLLARELGVGRVIYNDIDPTFLAAAQGIAEEVNAEAHQYILGDTDVLVETLAGNAIDALVSFDVLEHIYDLDDFLARLCSTPCCPRVLFMSSGANMFSPRYLGYVFPIQRERELLNRCKRVAIIRHYAPTLTEGQIVLLCRRTRLLVRREIECVVERYLQNSTVELPQKTGANAYDPFRSNTVDPETGWWAEHLVNPFYLSGQLRRYGFTAKIKPGFYGGKGAFLNPVIRSAGAAMALPIAPFYTVSALRYRSTRPLPGKETSPQTSRVQPAN